MMVEFEPQETADNEKAASKRYYIVGVLAAISFLNYLDRMALAMLVEPIKRDLDLSDTQMGLISGLAFAVLYAGFGLPLARIADRSSRVRLLSICLAFWSLMTALTGLARNFSELFAARVGVGVGEAGCVPASHSMIGDLFPASRRAFAISIFQAGGVVGMSAGLAVTGVIAEVWGWRAALVATGLIGLPLALLTWSTVKEPTRVASGLTRTGVETIVTTIKTLLGRRALLHIVLGLSVGAFAIYGLAQWVPAFYVRIHGLGLADVGLLAGGISAVGGVGGALAAGALMIKIGERDPRWELWMPAFSYCATGICWAATLLASNVVVAFSLQFIATFVAGATVVGTSAIQSHAEPHRRATAVALVLLLSSLIGLGLGPVAVGWWSDMLAHRAGVDGLRYAMICATMLLPWAGLHFWLAARCVQRSREIPTK